MIDGDLELALDFVVVGLEFGQGDGLLLDGLLQVDVGLVGNIQGHFQFSDMDLQLLLDADNFSPQLSLGFNYAGTQLLDFNAGLLAVRKSNSFTTVIIPTI